MEPATGYAPPHGSPHQRPMTGGDVQMAPDFTHRTKETTETKTTAAPRREKPAPSQDATTATVRAAASSLIDQLPYAWRYTLGSDVLYWGIIGMTALFAPDKALAWQYGVAKRFGWPALPASSSSVPSALAHVAGAAALTPVSDTLRMFVSLLGLFVLCLGGLAGWGAWSGDVRFARAYAAARALLVAGVSYLLASRAPRRAVYKQLLPYLLHGLWHLAALTASGPEFWGRANRALGTAAGLHPVAAARQLASAIEPLKREAAQAAASFTAAVGGDHGAGGGGGSGSGGRGAASDAAAATSGSRGDTGGQQY